MKKISPNFPEFIHKELHKLCSEFIDIFALESEEINASNLYKQGLRLKDNQSVHIKNYKISYPHKEEVNKQVTKLINDDIVELSTSEQSNTLSM